MTNRFLLSKRLSRSMLRLLQQFRSVSLWLCTALQVSCSSASDSVSYGSLFIHHIDFDIISSRLILLSTHHTDLYITNSRLDRRCSRRN